MSERRDLPPSIVTLIAADGSAVRDDRYSAPPVAELVAAYRSMVLGRRLNEQASALVRQGQLAVYPSSFGQEACQIAAAAVLRPDDWLFPTYRDAVAVVHRGVDPVEVLTLLRGDWHCGYDPVAHRVAPQATPLATQLPHAVGVGHAARLRGADTVALAMCGDGATSEGDFHAALNFAAVFAAPVVFLVQNNGYAISVPTSHQYAATSLADKGIGYGVPAVLVDGNDYAALAAVLHDAVRRAAEGAGPTLVEARTYRIEAHTNADDATRYRDDAEVELWRTRDPLRRLRIRLRELGSLDDATEAEIAAEAESVAHDVRIGVAAHAPADPAELFAHVYARPTPQLLAQVAQLAEEIAR
ncbi:thiamine pyrophosphate-dependent enzyme [Amycolatopsis sp. NPDC059090]|uniref:thiamine pyrophosphate-dependent enzyme n=1 Tax=Amycolatopsis sp. NPDC059090 TaxID=3346723 RepID=UPI00366B5971